MWFSNWHQSFLLCNHLLRNQRKLPVLVLVTQACAVLLLPSVVVMPYVCFICVSENFKDNNCDWIIYRVSQEECARLREGVPYVKVYRYNPKHLCPKLNSYGDNGQRKVWSSGGSTHCTCQLTSLIDVCFWVWCRIQLTLAVQLCSRLIPECAVSHVTSVLAFMCHV